MTNGKSENEKRKKLKFIEFSLTKQWLPYLCTHFFTRECLIKAISFIRCSLALLLCSNKTIIGRRGEKMKKQSQMEDVMNEVLERQEIFESLRWFACVIGASKWVPLKLKLPVNCCHRSQLERSETSLIKITSL